MSTAFAVLHRSATGREDQAGCPLGREALAARPAPDLRCGGSRWFVKGRLASNRANQRAALAGCPLGREAPAARPAPDLRCGGSRWLVKGRLASNPASQRAALAGCPLGREGPAARPAPDLRCVSSRWLVKGASHLTVQVKERRWRDAPWGVRRLPHGPRLTLDAGVHAGS